MKLYWWILIGLVILVIIWLIVRYTPPRKFTVGYELSKLGADIAYYEYTFKDGLYYREMIGGITGGLPKEEINKEEWWNSYNKRDKK